MSKSVISCFQVLKSVSASKSNSWFHGVHLYDSTFNWKGPKALTKTWQKRPRSWLSETCWSCVTLLSVLLAVLAKFWDLTLTIWNEKGFCRSIHVRIQMLAKHSLESQAHQILSLVFQLSLAANLQRHRKPMSPFHLANRSRSAVKPVADAQIDSQQNFTQRSLDPCNRCAPESSWFGGANPSTHTAPI